jgi:hypothetical protein
MTLISVVANFSTASLHDGRRYNEKSKKLPEYAT